MWVFNINKYSIRISLSDHKAHKWMKSIHPKYHSTNSQMPFWEFVWSVFELIIKDLWFWRDSSNWVWQAKWNLKGEVKFTKHWLSDESSDKQTLWNAPLRSLWICVHTRLLGDLVIRTCQRVFVVLEYTKY